ncbi:MAG: RHS repeat-associated core domain-containing protein [Verrucomicrobiota bacterium]
MLGNHAGTAGGGISAYSTVDTECFNTIIWTNTAVFFSNQIYQAGQLSVTYSDVQGGFSGTGNINTNPAFTRLGYRLTAASPCIDAGTANGAPATDIDGEPRNPDIGIDEFIDTDSDGMADIWETEYFQNLSKTATSDFDGDGLNNVTEYEYSTDPTSNVDTDGDGLSNDAEIYHGTDPDNWDTDGDLMPDGWEVEYGMDPLDNSDGSSDSDGDDLKALEEMRYGTDPFSADTDGDGVSDYDEVMNGSDPSDGDDHGDPANCRSLELVVGDWSSSNSERYELQVGSATIHHVSEDFGTVSAGTYSFVEGKKYPFQVRWIATDPEKLEYDYDYEARIGGKPTGDTGSEWMYGAGFSIHDPEGILGKYSNRGNNGEPNAFGMAGKTGTLHIVETDTCDEETSDTPHPDPTQSDSVDPINTINGAVTITETDIVVPAPGIPLVFRRGYNSRFEHTNSPVGARWNHSYDWDLYDETDHYYRGVTSDWKVLRTGEGDLHWFKALTNGTFEPPDGLDYRLFDQTNNYRLLMNGTITCLFNTNGLLYSMSDTHSNALSFAYTNTGGLEAVSRIEHSSGQTLDFTYENGRLLRVDSPVDSLYMTYAYNASGQITNATRHTSEASYTTTYRYGNLHSLTQRVNAAGNVFAYDYIFSTNASDLVIAKGCSMILNTNWYEHSLDYNTASNYTTLTYQRGATSQAYEYHYHPETMVTKKVYGPNGTNQVTIYSHDNDHNLIGVKKMDNTTGNQLLTIRSYDSKHNLTSSGIGFNAVPSNIWNYVWNSTNGTLLSATDPEGNQTTFEYLDTLPVAMRLSPEEGKTNTTFYGYTTNGLLSAVTNANGHWTRFGYNNYGYQTSSIPQAGPVINYRYSPLGHVTNICMPGPSGPRVTILNPDELGRIRTVTLPDGRTESFLYDKMGNLTNHVDAGDRETTYTYAPTRKLTSVTRGSGDETATITFDYDQQFNTLNIRDALNRPVENYLLDIQDRPVTITNLEGQAMSISYGLADMVTSLTRFDGTTVSNTYDSSARLASVNWPGLTNSFTYYANSLMKTAVNETGVISNQYNGANRLISVYSEFSTFSSLNSFCFDAVGNVTSAVATINSSAALTNRCSFDAAERVSEISGSGGDFDFSYNQYNGLIAQISNSVSGIHVEYSFDNVDRITDIVWRDETNGILRSFGYAHNRAGLITNVTRETGGWAVYRYDSLDRLTNETVHSAGGPVTNDYSWKYDLTGNRTNAVQNETTNVYSLGNGNRLSTFGPSGTVLHDDAGNITNMVYNDGRELDLTWNSRYQVTAISTNGTTAESYQYGPLGRRTRTVSGNSTNFFVYDGQQIIAEVDPSGALKKSYTWGPGIDNLLAFTDHTGGETNTYYALTDHLGTVHSLVDETGAIVESYEYDAWGRVLGVYDSDGTPINESAVGNNVLWQGREYSWKTGLYYFRARWYDPVTGRWLSKDPIGISGGLNQYQAFLSNPVNYRDPFGLCAEDGYSLSQVEWAMGRTARRIAGNPAYGGAGTISSSLLDALQRGGNTTSLGSSAVLFGDSLHALTTGAPIRYGRYGMEVTGRSVRGPALAPQVARGVKVAGGVASVVGAGFDARDAGAAFGSSDTATGISRSSSMAGGVLGIVYWPAAVGTILGNATAAGIDAGYSAADNARNEAQLQADEARMIQLMRLHRSLR